MRSLEQLIGCFCQSFRRWTRLGWLLWRLLIGRGLYSHLLNDLNWRGLSIEVVLNLLKISLVVFELNQVATNYVVSPPQSCFWHTRSSPILLSLLHQFTARANLSLRLEWLTWDWGSVWYTSITTGAADDEHILINLQFYAFLLFCARSLLRLWAKTRSTLALENGYWVLLKLTRTLLQRWLRWVLPRGYVLCWQDWSLQTRGARRRIKTFTDMHDTAMKALSFGCEGGRVCLARNIHSATVRWTRLHDGADKSRSFLTARCRHRRDLWRMMLDRCCDACSTFSVDPLDRFLAIICFGPWWNEVGLIDSSVCFDAVHLLGVSVYLLCSNSYYEIYYNWY